jgi:hypothetical protein
MKKSLNLTNSILFFLVVIFFYQCNNEEYSSEPEINLVEAAEDPADPENEDSGLNVPEEQLISYTKHLYEKQSDDFLKYGHVSHKNFVYHCAKKLGIDEDRAVIMRNASIMPDEYQSGIDNAFNQQWSHAYIVIKAFWGMQWVWGDADDDFYDNLLGDSGESESPEGYNGKWAGYYYVSGNQDLGDWYVGYACHYISDVSIVLHTSFPDINMLNYHNDYEEWIDNNWYSGHNFSEVGENISASAYYTFSDPKEAIRNAAKGSNYSYNNYARKAWDNYMSSGHPTDSGTGNEACVTNTRKMIAEAVKWTGGAIKFALNRYDQW